MKSIIGVVLAAVVLVTMGSAVPAGDKKGSDPKAIAILDKAIKALGGEEKLTGPKGFVSKGKGTVTFANNQTEFTSQSTVAGLDRYRGDLTIASGGNKATFVTVFDGDKGWRKTPAATQKMDRDVLANEKRAVYLMAIASLVVPAKGKGFKVETAGEDKVDGKPAVGVKITGPDGKDFKLYFDKESGLPVKQVARVKGFMGEDVDQETMYSGYKEFDGIKKATRIEGKRAGQTFLKQEITEFKALSKVDEKAFAEPK
jgi:hypothetical protein